MTSLVGKLREFGDGLLSVPAAWLSRGKIHILMYHRVLPDGEAGGYPLANLVVPEEQFVQQMSWLKQRARVLPVSEAIEASACSKPTVCVTFDDGYECNARVAQPVLERYGLRGTFYVTTDFIEGKALWFDAAAEVLKADPDSVSLACERGGHRGASSNGLDGWLGFLKSLPSMRRRELLADCGAPDVVPGCGSMSPSQLKTLADAGHEIGSHTATHPILPIESEEIVREELSRSSECIAEWTDSRPVGLCYPNGDHSSEVREAARQAGYRYACEIGRGSHRAGADDLFSVRRRFVTRWNTAVGQRHSDSGFAGEVLGVHDAIRRVSRKLRR